MLLLKRTPPSLWDLIHTAPRPDCSAFSFGGDGSSSSNATSTLRYFESSLQLRDDSSMLRNARPAAGSGQGDGEDDLRIPRIVHFTSKSRCLSPIVYDNLMRWKNHSTAGALSYVFHDDDAMDRLLYGTDWSDLFPHLDLILRRCTISGAAKADVWRALVVWQYGGIYSDIDNAPGPHFGNSSLVLDDYRHDSYFLIETAGIASQYFFAATPKHPIMYLLVQACLLRVMQVESVGMQYTPHVTGPGALKEVVYQFLGANSSALAKGANHLQPGRHEGVVGIGRSMTIDGGKFGSANPSWKIIARESIKGKDKRAAYEQMSMKHFNRSKRPDLKDSCLVHIYNQNLISMSEGGMPGHFADLLTSFYKEHDPSMVERVPRMLRRFKVRFRMRKF